MCEGSLHGLSEVSETVVGKQLVSNTENILLPRCAFLLFERSSGDQLTV